MSSASRLFLLSFFLLSSLLLNAQLTFEKRSYPVSTPRLQRSDLKRADFNGDGFQDLFINGTLVLLNNGDGTFDSSHPLTLTVPIRANVLLDFNRDGNLDIAGCTEKDTSILKGNGDGTFSLLLTIPIACRAITTADFNKDGNPDIAIGFPTGPADALNNKVNVYLGDGSGGIAGEVHHDDVTFFTDADHVRCAPFGPGVAADFTGDKKADVVFAATCGNFYPYSYSALIVGIGDGTGHFTFHKDQEFRLEAIGMDMRLGDVSQDWRTDIITLAVFSFPFGSTNFLTEFRSRGNGTFERRDIFQSDGSIGAGTIADLDGGGTKDAALVETNFTNLQSVFRFLRVQPDGTYKVAQSSPLATDANGMIWGDFDRDGRVDLVLARLDRRTGLTFAVDVWLNRTSTAPICPADPAIRSVHLCMPESSSSGDFHVLANQSDNRPVEAMQIYVDGSVRFLTPDDLINTNLKLSPGQHRITAKAWDDLGPFSTTKFVVVSSECDNSTDRTVRICFPTNGASVTSPVRVLANAATSKPFQTIQVYVDGTLRFHDTVKFLDIFVTLSAGTHRITVKGWDTVGAFSSSVSAAVR